jgi:hypothetical protein
VSVLPDLCLSCLSPGGVAEVKSAESVREQLGIWPF